PSLPSFPPRRSSDLAPRWRWIAPHAIAFDGFRWHARAYCFTDGCFKDFLLARILGIRDSRPSDIDDSQDANWHTHVTLEIGPHPDRKSTRLNSSHVK